MVYVTVLLILRLHSIQFQDDLNKNELKRMWKEVVVA